MKRIISLWILIVILFSLSSCDISLFSISDEESDLLIELYFDAVQKGDLETAAIDLHHKSVIEDMKLSDEELVDEYLNWLLEVQSRNNVCFDDGFKVLRCKHKTIALYDLVKGGGYKKVELDVQVGDDTQNIIWATFEFLKNDDGLGIYNVTM